MMSDTNRKKMAVGAVIAIAVVALSAIKLVVKNGASYAGKITAAEPDASVVYLFYNEQDQNCGCKEIYDAFDKERASLPNGIQSAKIRVGENEPLFEKYSIRVLPTVLFVDKKGEVKERIEGEGKEIERQLSATFARAWDILKR